MHVVGRFAEVTHGTPSSNRPVLNGVIELAEIVLFIVKSL